MGGQEPGTLGERRSEMVGGWTVPTEHLIVQVIEAPNFEAMQAYASEPEVVNVAVGTSWNTKW